MKLVYVIMLLLPGLLLAPVLANRGSMVTGPKDIKLYESQQRAIIAWNGTEEILILSTDINSSQPVQVLEVLPVPDIPMVDKGNTQSFIKLTTVLSHTYRSPDAVEIKFHQKIDVHDITGLEAHNADRFVKRVDEITERYKIC